MISFLVTELSVHIAAKPFAKLPVKALRFKRASNRFKSANPISDPLSNPMHCNSTSPVYAVSRRQEVLAVRDEYIVTMNSLNL